MSETRRITKARELREAMAKYVPTDAAFEEAFSTARVSRPRLARYYLRALEKTLSDDPQPEYVANEEVTDITLEHVLPLSITEDWGVDYDEARAAQRMLGNMTLVRAVQNRDLGRKVFSDKRNVYADSGYRLTAELSSYERWGLVQIRERQTRLAKIAVKTWPLTFSN